MNEPSEAVLSSVRVELRKANIQLWKAPYTNSDSTAGDLQSLADEISNSTKLSVSDTAKSLEYLREFALQRLQQNEKFKHQNIATLKLKFSPPVLVTKSKQTTTKAQSIIECKLDVTGEDLRSRIASIINIECNLLKLVFSGKVLNLQKMISVQGVTNNKTILVIVFNKENKLQTEETESHINKIKSYRRGAELLASSSTSTSQDYDLQISDQNGRAIDIPENEKSSLTTALTLHEKGRALLRKQQYSISLLYLLEADTEFKNCRSEILTVVDNFSILCLDIAWCYLCLQSLDALPGVAIRLKSCEESFKKSYGESMQRLCSIKGNSSHEIALFVRLYLLQGIAFYHEGKFNEAKELICKAESYAKTIIVDENLISQMMVLGFTSSESRLALRACDLNVNAACQYAFQKREEKEKIKIEEEKKRRSKKLTKTYGPCKNGDNINVDMFDQMVKDLGFNKETAATALILGNNDISKATEIINNQPDLFNALEIKSSTKISKKKIKEVSELGFSFDASKAAISHFTGNKEKAVKYLIDNQGAVPSEWILSSAQTDDEVDVKNMKEVAKVVNNESDYLDIKLDEELNYIRQYFGLLSSVL